MGNKKENLELLIGYIRGQLSPEDTVLAEQKMEEDPVLRELASVLSEMRLENDNIDWQKMKNPSHNLFDRLFQDIKANKGANADKQGILIFDSQMLPLPEGVRSAAVDTRRVKYIIGDAQLEISIYPVSPSSFELIGQMTGIDESESLEMELTSGKAKVKARANQFNLFRYPRVRSGAYKLSIRGNNSIIGKINIEL